MAGGEKKDSYSMGKDAKILLSELAATVHTYDYHPTSQDGELLSALRMSSALGQGAAMIGGGAVTYSLARFVPYLRRRQNLRIGAALGGGFAMKSMMDAAIFIVSVQQLASLNTPMGGEMEALVLESDLPSETKTQFLRLKQMAPSAPHASRLRICPTHSPFSEAMLQNADAESVPQPPGSPMDRGPVSDGRGQDAEWRDGFTGDREAWGPSAGRDPEWSGGLGAGGRQGSGRFGGRNTEWQRSGTGAGLASGAEEGMRSPDPPGEGGLEDDIFSMGEESGPETERRPATREVPPRHRDRRARRRDHQQKAKAEDSMDDYFDSRWDGKGTA